MSALVATGSAQFIAISLMAAGAALPVIALSTVVVNLRFALYSASLREHVLALGVRWRIVIALLISDESFALSMRRYSTPGPSTCRHWYFVGSGLSMYVNWVAWTAVGVWVGQAVAGLEALNLDFAFVATITALVASMLTNRAAVGAAVVAMLVAVTARALPYQLGLMLAAVAGAGVGALFENASRDRASQATRETG